MKNTGAPTISVVMPVYNGESYLDEAVESILNQTFTDFEFIIINDGSTDDTGAILARHQAADRRISVFDQANQGVVASMNRGCSLAKGKYIARMDADDICLPDRFEHQVAFLDARPEVGILGAWIEYIDADGHTFDSWIMPTEPALINWSLMFGNCLAHPTVIMRRDTVRELSGYRPATDYFEDYDLWVRATVVTSLANLPEVQLKRRTWNDNITTVHNRVQEEGAIKIMGRMMTATLGSPVDQGVVLAMRQIFNGSDVPAGQIKAAARLLHRLRRAYLKRNRLTPGVRRMITRDAGKKLYALAAAAGKDSRRASLRLFSQALRTSPELLSKSIIKREGRALMRRGLNR